MKHGAFLIGFTVLLCSVSNAQVFEQWATSYNGPAGSGDEAKAIAVDGSGNTYVTGRATNAAGNYDYATIKYNSTGVQQWVVLLNGTYSGDDVAQAIAVDAAGNVYITGKLQDMNSDYDIVTVKYNTNGVQQWATSFNGTGYGPDEGVAIAVDGTGNVYVTGTTTTAFPYTDYITIKYNNAGVQQWARQYNGSGMYIDFAKDIEVDGSGNVYITGKSRTVTYDFDIVTIKYNSAGVQQWVAAYDSGTHDQEEGTALDLDAANNVIVTGWCGDGFGNYITIKYDNAGVQQWLALYDGAAGDYDYASDVVVDATNSIIVTGYSLDALQGYNYMTVKYSSAGVQQWATPLNGTGNSPDYAQKICTDASDNIYVIGYSTNSGYNYDYTTVKYNTSGAEQWRISYNGLGNNNDLGAAIAVDASGAVYVTGKSFLVSTGDNYVTIKYLQGAVPLSANQSQTNLTCNGSCSGNATVAPFGGTSPYTYTWTPSGGNAATASSLCAGLYTCTITDATSATATVTFNITQPPALTATSSQTNIACYGQCNGIASVNPGGGTPPYTYSWIPSGPTGATITNACAGSYTCTIFDANLCTTTVTFNITQPPAPVVTSSSTNVTCNNACNGTANVISVTNLSGPYTYSWSPNVSSTAGATNLCAGTYTCTITGASGCTTSKTFSITQPAAVSVSSTVTNVVCNGDSTGAICVNASGGVGGPYSYAWSQGGTAPCVSSVPAGCYTVAVTDASGCTTTSSPCITQPSVISPNSLQNNITCAGGGNGHMAVAPSGGASGYTYSWTPVSNSTNVLNGSPAGFYTCTITDASGCTATATFNLTEPPALAVVPSQTNIACSGGTGTASVSVSGGVPGYSYAWMPAGGTNPTSDPLTVGAYTCTITDLNGCTASAPFTITEPGAPTVTYSEPMDTACGGTIPTPAFTLSGESPAGGTWTGPGVTGNTFDPVNANIGYNLIIYSYTDVNGCSGSATDSIWVDLCLDVTTTGTAGTINVYPNPTSGSFNLFAPGNSTVRMFDAMGNEVMNLQTNAEKTEIDMSSFADGVYMITVQNGNTITTERIILSR